MQTNEQLLSVIENYLAQTELPAEPELLYAPIGYSLSGGGKRLRPMLVMLSCGIFSDDALQALPAAAAVEMFHNFTLLHDDIMDNAAVRRGKPSVFARWGQNVAILSGDAMMISSYRLLSGVPPRLLPQIMWCRGWRSFCRTTPWTASILTITFTRRQTLPSTRHSLQRPVRQTLPHGGGRM